MIILASLSVWFLPPLWLKPDRSRRVSLQLLLGPWFPFIVIGVLFYFLLIRPERRKRTEVSQMLDNLKKNDHVVTIGGIYGVVINAQKGSEDVTIRVDDGNNTKLRVLRTAISRVVSTARGRREEGILLTRGRILAKPGDARRFPPARVSIRYSKWRANPMVPGPLSRPGRQAWAADGIGCGFCR